MLFRRRARDGQPRDWFAVVLDVVVVMVGLVAAFQIDRWWEERGERLAEGAYLERLIADVGEDVPTLEAAIRLAEVRKGFAEHLAAVVADEDLAVERPAYFLAAVQQAAYTYTPSLASSTFDDLRSTGNMPLIRDGALRRDLRRYYAFDEGQRQFIDLNLQIELRYLELSAGVATLEQHRELQDRWFVVTEARLAELDAYRPDEASVRAAARRLAADADLVAWLPRVRGLQVDQIVALTARLERARALEATLLAYADRTAG